MDLIEMVTSTILSIRDSYMDKGNLKYYSEINAGLCCEFAEDVVYTLRELTKCKPQVFSSDYLMIEENDDLSDRWDIDILKSRSDVQLPDGFTFNDLNNMNIGYHVWITYKSLHFDAECPQGVRNIFDLPFYQRCFERYDKLKSNV